MYKLEMHVHTSPTSRCASAKAEDAVTQYTQAGYHGLVLTNHINNSTYRYMEDMPWNEKVAHFVRGQADGALWLRNQPDAPGSAQVYSQ